MNTTNEAGVVLAAFLRTIDADDDGYMGRIVEWMNGNGVFGDALDAGLDRDALRDRLADAAA